MQSVEELCSSKDTCKLLDLGWNILPLNIWRDGCRGKVHVWCCHWLATNAAFIHYEINHVVLVQGAFNDNLLSYFTLFNLTLYAMWTTHLSSCSRWSNFSLTSSKFHVVYEKNSMCMFSKICFLQIILGTQWISCNNTTNARMVSRWMYSRVFYWSFNFHINSQWYGWSWNPTVEFITSWLCGNTYVWQTFWNLCKSCWI